jgi:AcrR family transcriptional regulator
VSRVARKRSLARRRLIAAAIELIAEKGVDGLRLREIADRADIGFGSFYNHFASKEELVEAVVAEYVGSLTQAIIVNATGSADPAETTAVAHRMFVRLAYDDPQLAWVIVHLDRSDALLETASHPHLGAVLARGMETGRFHGIEIDVAISFIVGATIAVMRGILEGRLGADADVGSARTLLRACGLTDAEARELASRELRPSTTYFPAGP